MTQDLRGAMAKKPKTARWHDEADAAGAKAAADGPELKKKRRHDDAQPVEQPAAAVPELKPKRWRARLAAEAAQGISKGKSAKGATGAKGASKDASKAAKGVKGAKGATGKGKGKGTKHTDILSRVVASIDIDND